MTPQRYQNVAIKKTHKEFIAQIVMDSLSQDAPCSAQELRCLLKKSKIPIRSWISSDQIKGIVSRLSKFYKKHSEKGKNWSLLVEASQAARTYADTHKIDLHTLKDKWDCSISEPMLRKYHTESINVNDCEFCQVSL